MRIAAAQANIQRYIEQFGIHQFLNDAMLSQLQLFHFPVYSHIYMAQDEQHHLYFLVEGSVQCSHYHLNGKLAVFAVSTPFCAIGDLEILSEERVYSNVIATHETVMLALTREVVHQYGAQDPRFLRFLLEQMRQKLYKSNALQINQVLPVINRLAVYLLAQQTGQANQQGMRQVVLPAKDDLASLLGTTTRHLNRVLRELVQMGAVDISQYPCVLILDETALQQLNL